MHAIMSSQLSARAEVTSVLPCCPVATMAAAAAALPFLLLYSVSPSLAFSPCSISTTRFTTTVTNINNKRNDFTGSSGGGGGGNKTPIATRQQLFNAEHAGNAAKRPPPGAQQQNPPPGDGKKSSSSNSRGSWGSWTKVISQRKEQQEVLNSMSLNSAANQAATGLRVRTSLKDDMRAVSHLCVDTFRGPYEWYMLPLQIFHEFTFFAAINGRLGSVTRNEIQHGMVVVEDTTSNKVVGFLELGMLPPPNSSEQSPLRANALPDTSKMDTNNNPSGSSGSTSSDSSECSEGGIWNEAANTAGAMAAVGALNAPPSPSNDKLEGKDLNGDISAASDNKQKRSPKRSKQPEVAYLANVVVDKNQRRRGIATLMVASAEEIVKALWPDEDRLYVSVEQGNDIAVALYKSMGFESMGTEEEMIARSLRRKPRNFLSKSLV